MRLRPPGWCCGGLALGRNSQKVLAAVERFQRSEALTVQYGGDFYYGECEMRRHDVTGAPTGERRLLSAYWLLSGYGLRASRAFSWLLTAMTLTVLLLMSTGLPTHAPDPALRGSWSARFTTDRAEKATRVAINSVIFRSSGQNLITAGTCIELASRLLEPTLLALGVLAIRGRIKR